MGNDKFASLHNIQYDSPLDGEAYDQLTETPMTNPFMSLLDRVGASREFLGDSTGRLSGL